MAKSSMGFLADLKATPSCRKKPEKPVVLPDPQDLVVSFDSGKGLTFADSLHHAICFGTTGSGKTASILLPAINRILKAGYGLIMGDIKGSLGPSVRKLAANCGRAGDVVEYGSDPLAERKNMLAFMSDDGIRSYFESMVNEIASGDGRIWALKGAVIAADCAILMRLVAEKRNGFWPTMSMVNEMINDQFRASEFYNLFLDEYYDESDERQRRFVTAIDNNRFHILVRVKKSQKSNFPGSKSDKDNKLDRSYEEQLTWNMQTIRLALRSFLEAPGIERNFSAYASPGINLPGDIDAGKIILLRFDARSGQTGATLTRRLLSEAYRHVLSGKMIPERFHVVLDEFQEYADFSDSAGSDKNFVALAREFGGSFIAGTQSVAALTCKVGNNMPVEAFLGNCNSIMSFYSHDAATQELVCRYNPRVRLNRFKPGQLFAVTYNSSGRIHNHNMESVNKGYRELASLLASLPDLPEVRDDGAVADRSWTWLADSLKKEIESRKEEEKRMQAEEQERRLEQEREEREREAAERRRRQEEERQRQLRSQPRDAWDLPDDGDDRKSGSDCVEEKLDPFVAKLRDDFPDLFSKRFIKADIPDGWKSFAVEALQLFKSTGMRIAKISSLTFDSGVMRVSTESYNESAADEVLNSILSKSRTLCMICGKEKGKRGSFPICESCQKSQSVRENSQALNN